MKRRDAWAVTNMLKQVCNVEAVIDGNKYVETGVQCGSCYRWYHYKCEGTNEKEIKKLYPEETHYICKNDQNSESIIKWKNQYRLKQK